MSFATDNEPAVELTQEHDGRVARLTILGVPHQAFDLRLLESFQSSVTALAGWPELCCVMLEGGTRDFSTGFAAAHLETPYVQLLMQSFHAVARALSELDALLVASVRGKCIGPGAELTLLCQAVFADSSTRIAFPDAEQGRFSPLATLLLPERVGPLRATPWLLTGRVLSAEEALASGLISEFAAGWDSLATISERFVEKVVLPRTNEAVRLHARALRQPLLAKLNNELPELERLYLHRFGRGATSG
jgi:enoyl-CoA hydratase/carnithine racemase